jgi:hypothetical protein
MPIKPGCRLTIKIRSSKDKDKDKDKDAEEFLHVHAHLPVRSCVHAQRRRMCF